MQLESSSYVEQAAGQPLLTLTLRGGVFHSGATLRSGHYVSLAVDALGALYEANDDVITNSFDNEWNTAGNNGEAYLLGLTTEDSQFPPVLHAAAREIARQAAATSVYFLAPAATAASAAAAASADDAWTTPKHTGRGGVTEALEAELLVCFFVVPHLVYLF